MLYHHNARVLGITCLLKVRKWRLITHRSQSSDVVDQRRFRMWLWLVTLYTHMCVHLQRQDEPGAEPPDGPTTVVSNSYVFSLSLSSPPLLDDSSVVVVVVVVVTSSWTGSGSAAPRCRTRCSRCHSLSLTVTTTMRQRVSKAQSRRTSRNSTLHCSTRSQPAS